MKKSYIYMYLDQNNIPFYIGKGKGDRYRVYKHLYRNSNKLVTDKIKEIGINNIKICFLNTDLTNSEAVCMEKYWISGVGRYNLDKGPLCNLTDGGTGNNGYVMTLEHKQKISMAMKGKKGNRTGCILSEETRKKISEGNKGKKVSEEARKKIGRGNKGKKRTEETKEKLRQLRLGKKATEETKEKMRLTWEKRKLYKKTNFGDTI